MIKRNFSHRNGMKGMLFVAVVLALTVLGILIPALITYLQKESKDAVGEKRKTTALQLAEAGQDRGAWKLRESDTIWNNAVAGSTLTGYNFDTVYADVSGGSYKIQFSPGSVSGQVKVVSKGQTSGSTEIRTIEAIYSKGNTAGAMTITGGLTWKPGMHVHWGSLVEYTSIDSTPPDYFPRKYSAGQIVGRDIVNDSNNGAMPSGNWTAYDYAAFYNLGTAPSVNLPSYLLLAQATTIPALSGGTASPVGSGYYPSGDITIPNNYSLTCSTCVIYLGGKLKKFPGGGVSAWLDIKALIVIGDVDYNADGTDYAATIPTRAQDEYQHPTAAAVWTTAGWTNGAVTTIYDVGMHGFLYCGGDMDNSGGNAILVGSAFIAGSISLNRFIVYYDSTVGSNVLYSNQTITRVSWDETLTSW
jgi:hypothetical protein